MFLKPYLKVLRYNLVLSIGVRREQYPVEGVQFHPESIKMKPHRMNILRNFLNTGYKKSGG